MSQYYKSHAMDYLNLKVDDETQLSTSTPITDVPIIVSDQGSAGSLFSFLGHGQNRSRWMPKQAGYCKFKNSQLTKLRVKQYFTRM